MDVSRDPIAILEHHTNADCIAIDIETTGLHGASEIVSAAVSFTSGGVIHTNSYWIDRFHDQNEFEQAQLERLLTLTIFNSGYPGTIIFHNLDFDLRFLLDRFYHKDRLLIKNFPKMMDTLTISRVKRNNKFVSHTDPRKLRCHSLKYLASEILGEQQTSFEDVVDRANIRFANRQDVMTYNERDAELTLKLYLKFMENTPSAEWDYIEKIEMPHVLNLLQMNWHGVHYDVTGAKELNHNLEMYTMQLEREVFQEVGRTFNIQSNQELAAALFYNQKLSYKNAAGLESLIKPFYVTEQGRRKINIDTLKTIQQHIREVDPSATPVETIEKVIHLLEVRKSLAFIENHLNIIEASDHEELHPNFSADAKSGRVKSSRPNLLGLPKAVFKKSDREQLPPEIKNASVRQLVRAPQGYKVASIDISALDLAVVTHGALKFNSDFSWGQFFGSRHELDIHLMIACLTNKGRFQKLFLETVGTEIDLDKYSILKLDEKDDGIKVVDKKTDIPKVFQFISGESDFKRVSRNRKLFKVVNLSTSYLMGAKNMAVSIRKEIGENIGSDEAQDLLDSFYKAFPEIRQFQDHICNLVYHQGYAETVFGRKFYADCFDELNQHHRTDNSTYEFIWWDGKDYWYIKARHWIKFEDDVIEDLRVVKKPFGFIFKEILSCEKMDRRIFSKRKNKISKKFNRQSESNMENLGSFELSRIAISNEVDRAIKLGTSFTTESASLVESFICEGNYLLPEKGIVLYRTPRPEPSAKYFRYYTSLNKVVRKFFPLYCQGFANSLATQALTAIRESIEQKELDARILLFIHDQVDVLVADKDVIQMEQVLDEGVKCPKPPFNVLLSGKLEAPADHIK